MVTPMYNKEFLLDVDMSTRLFLEDLLHRDRAASFRVGALKKNV